MISTSLPGRMRVSLLGHWQRARPTQRFGYLVGGALIRSTWPPGGVAGGRRRMGGAGLLPQADHFGVSFGLTAITLAWVTGHLRIPDPARWLLLGPLATGDTYEVAGWRPSAGAGGLPLQRATTPDYALLLTGAAAIAVTVTVVLPVLAFTVVRAPPSMAVAIRAGLLVLLVAQGVGGWIQHGTGLADQA